MQSHNHMKRFEGLVLPDCLEALYLVRQSDPMQLRMRCVRLGFGWAAAFHTCALSFRSCLQNYNCIAAIGDVAVNVPPKCSLVWQPKVSRRLSWAKRV